jgi:hypothetical protein
MKKWFIVGAMAKKEWFKKRADDVIAEVLAENTTDAITEMKKHLRSKGKGPGKYVLIAKIAK